MKIDNKKNHVIELRSALSFIEDTLEVCSLKKENILVEMGKLKNNVNGPTLVYRFIFNKNDWNIEDANSWISENGKMLEYMNGKNEAVSFGKEEGNKPMADKIKKVITCEVKNFNDDEQTFEAIASTDDVDRDGDILRASGWKLKNYKKNPVILWAHQSGMPPIGKSIKTWVEGNALKFIPKFAPEEIYPFAAMIYKMFRQGFLNAFSIWFDPIKWENIEQPEARPNERSFWMPREYTKQDLLEISPVTVPANPHALAEKDYQQMIIKSNELKHLDIMTPERKVMFFTGDCKKWYEGVPMIGSVKQTASEPLKKGTQKPPADPDLQVDIKDMLTIKCEECEKSFTIKKGAEDIVCPGCEEKLDINGKKVAEDKPVADNIKCPNCDYVFNPDDGPEHAMGSVKCPECGVVLDQEGNKVETDPEPKSLTKEDCKEFIETLKVMTESLNKCGESIKVFFDAFKDSDAIVEELKADIESDKTLESVEKALKGIQEQINSLGK